MKHGENNFDAIRLVAAGAVIFSHAKPLTGSHEILILGSSVGGIAVKIFFVISGYLIYKSWSVDPDLRRYLIKRSLRIFPALVVLCMVTVLVVGPLLTSRSVAEYFTSRATYGYFRNILLCPVYHLPGMFEKNIYPGAVNGSLWSLPVEFLLYLVTPVVCFINRKHAFWSWMLPMATLGLCVVSLWLVRISPLNPSPVFYGTALLPTLDVAPYFFIGALYCRMRWERFVDPTIALFAVAIAAFIQLTGAVADEVVLYLLLPYAVLAAAYLPQRWLKRAGRFGDMSYGVYIYAFLVQQCVCQLGNNRLSATQSAMVTLPIVLVLAWISWHLVEKRALAFKPSRDRKVSELLTAS